MRITALRSVVVNGVNKNALLLASLTSIQRQLVWRSFNTINAISNGNPIILANSQPKSLLIIAKRYEKFGFERLPYRLKGIIIYTDSPFEKIFRYVMVGFFLFMCFGVNMSQYPQNHYPKLKKGEERPEPKDSKIYLGDYFKGFWSEFFVYLEEGKKRN